MCMFIYGSTSKKRLTNWDGEKYIMIYPIYIEKDERSDFGVTVPDLPGCFSAGSTMEEAIANAEEAILTHLEGLMLDSDPIPYPTSIKELQTKYNSLSGIWVLVTIDKKLGQAYLPKRF